MAITFRPPPLWWILAALLILTAGLQLSGADAPAPPASPDSVLVESPHLLRPLTVPAGKLLVSTPHYTLCLDPATKLADWCGFVVIPAWWAVDKGENRNWHHKHPDHCLEADDYEGSGYQRGHLCPLGSFRGSTEARCVNRMENIVPMSPRLNMGVWRALEEHTRNLSRGSPVNCLVGTLYETDLPPLPGADEPHRVPSHLWAWLVYQHVGTGEIRGEAYICPQAPPLGATREQYRVPWEELQRRCGLRLE